MGIKVSAWLAVPILLLGAQAAVAQWVVGGGSTGSESGWKLEVDSEGNSYLTGWFEGTVDFDPGAGVHNLTSQGGEDAFIVKYDVNGQFVWAFSIGGAENDMFRDLYLDTENELIYVAGSFRMTVDFDPGAGVTQRTSAGHGDAFIAAYSTDGAFLSVHQFEGTGNDAADAIGFDAQSNLYLIGNFSGTIDMDLGPDTRNLVSNGGADLFVAKLNHSLNYLWAFGLGGSATDRGRGMKVGTSGDVFIIGDFSSTLDADPGPGTALLNSNGLDALVAKYNSNGQFQWAFSVGDGGDAQFYDIALDHLGNTYLLGHFTGSADFDPGAGQVMLTSTGGYDIALAKYSTTGHYQWAFSLGGGLDDWGRAVDLDQAGFLYITGQFKLTFDFNPGPGVFNLTSAGFDDFYLAKFDTYGQFEHASRMGGTGDDESRGLAVRANSVYVTGRFEDTADFQPGLTGGERTSSGGYDFVMAKLNCGTYTVCLGVSTRLFLQGAYDTDTGSMRTDLNMLGLIPLGQPYNTSPWIHTGKEAVGDLSSLDIVDWVLVSLRTGSGRATEVAARAAFIRKDGMIVDLDGFSPVGFPDQAPGFYYVVIDHRNHLAVMSANSVSIAGQMPLYDFTQTPALAFGFDLIELEAGVYGAYAGDANRDGSILYIGGQRDQLEIINELGIGHLSDKATGYLSADLNMDGFVHFVGAKRDQFELIRALSLNNLAGMIQTQVPD